MLLPSSFFDWRRAIAAALLTASILFAPPGRAADSLTLEAAQQLALQRDPLIQQLSAQATEVRDAADASGQWPDPKVSLGLVNLPTNSYSVGRDSMTMQVVGVEQDFPAGDTRSLSQTRGQQLADAQAARVKDRKLEVTRDVRKAWFELHYAEHALPLVQQSEQVFQQLLDIAKVRYANGQGGEQDLARAELEMGMLQERELEFNADIDAARAALAKFVGDEVASEPLAGDLPTLPPISELEMGMLQERELEFNADIDAARAALAKFVGDEVASEPLAGDLPTLPQPPDQAELLKSLPQHPRIMAANTEVTAADTATDIARQAYKPVWGMDVSYGRRPGGDPAGMPYTNMLTAMVYVSVPLFTGDRQDRSVSAARAASSAAQYAVDDELRELKQMLDTDWAHWEHLGHIRDLYAKTILPSSSLNTQATLSAYRNGSVDFDELARAQISDLDSRTQQLKADVDYLEMQADLLYLAGEQP